MSATSTSVSLVIGFVNSVRCRSNGVVVLTGLQEIRLPVVPDRSRGLQINSGLRTVSVVREAQRFLQGFPALSHFPGTFDSGSFLRCRASNDGQNRRRGLAGNSGKFLPRGRHLKIVLEFGPILVNGGDGHAREHRVLQTRQARCEQPEAAAHLQSHRAIVSDHPDVNQTESERTLGHRSLFI